MRNAPLRIGQQPTDLDDVLNGALGERADLFCAPMQDGVGLRSHGALATCGGGAHRALRRFAVDDAGVCCWMRRRM